MDPLSALAVACAVAQFCDIGAKLARKAWAKYDRPRNKRTAQQTETLEFAAELSFLIDETREALTMLPTPNMATPTELHLRQVCSECDSAATELYRIVDDMAQSASSADGETNRQSRRNIFGGHGRSSRPAEDAIKSGDLEKALSRLEPLRRRVIDSVILCLWW